MQLLQVGMVVLSAPATPQLVVEGGTMEEAEGTLRTHCALGNCLSYYDVFIF